MWTILLLMTVCSVSSIDAGGQLKLQYVIGFDVSLVNTGKSFFKEIKAKVVGWNRLRTLQNFS